MKSPTLPRHPMPDISVIIPAINESACIRLAVDSAWAAGATQVLVVDGGSTDDTPRRAREAGAVVLVSPPGRAAQQNAGARRATGEFLWFLHADNRLSPACGAQLAEAADDASFALAAFGQRIEAEGWLYRWLERGNALRAAHLAMAYGDQALAIRRALFEQVGGFPDVPLMEDVRLMRTLRPLAPVRLLPGPVYVSPRRWQQAGLVRQTVHNQCLLAAERCGVSLDWLARVYRPHHAATADADQSSLWSRGLSDSESSSSRT